MRKEKITVVFQPDGKRCETERGNTILEAARGSGVDLASLCDGKSTCGKCKVIIMGGEGDLSEPTAVERKLLTEEMLREGYRLACTTKMNGDLVVNVPEESRKGRQRLQTEGMDVSIELDPVVRRMEITLPLPSFEDLRPDAERLLDHMVGGRGLSLAYPVLKNLPRYLREKAGEITVTLWNDRDIIDVSPGHNGDRCFGMAVDIGTTKMAGYLLDLNSGKVLSAGSTMNPQIPYGEDVVTRISFAEGAEGLNVLHEAVVGGINQILEEVCGNAGVLPREVYETTIVGNTAMHHLFLNVPPNFVATAPYVPAIRGSMDVRSSDLGVNIHPQGNIHVLPVIAGYVGADTVSGILATGMLESDELSFLIDVGTNTEVVLGNREGLLACSCASGPAFEGGFIKHGMRASTGAIEKVRIGPARVEYQTIGDGKPRGICGSAIVDIPAELLKAGVMDTSGRILTENADPRVRKMSDISEFVLVWGNETENGEDIVITQSDIREIQKAKAAMYSGASMLMRKLGMDRTDVRNVYVAGAFGSYIDPSSAKIIGMFPDFPLNAIKHVGNVAGTGARMTLISREARRRSDEISAMTDHMELSAEPGFEDEYIDAMYFPHMDLGRFPDTMRDMKGTRLKLAPRHRPWDG